MIILINKLINFGKVLVIPLGIIIIIPIILAILNIMGIKSYDIILLVIMIITSLISGLSMGSKITKHGYLRYSFRSCSSLIMFYSV